MADLQDRVNKLEDLVQRQSKLLAQTGQQLIALQVEAQKEKLRQVGDDGAKPGVSKKQAEEPEEGYITGEEIAQLVGELQGQLEIIEQRSIIRSKNVLHGDERLIRLPDNDGNLPEEFPENAGQFRDLWSKHQMMQLCKFYELVGGADNGAAGSQQAVSGGYLQHLKNEIKDEQHLNNEAEAEHLKDELKHLKNEVRHEHWKNNVKNEHIKSEELEIAHLKDEMIHMMHEIKDKHLKNDGKDVHLKNEVKGGQHLKNEVKGGHLKNEVKGGHLKNDVKGGHLKNEVKGGQHLKNEVKGEHLKNEVKGEHLKNEVKGEHLKNEVKGGEHLKNEVKGEHLKNEVKGQHLKNEVKGQHLKNEVKGQHLKNEVKGQHLKNEVKDEHLKNKVQGLEQLRNEIQRLALKQEQSLTKEEEAISEEELKTLLGDFCGINV